MGLPEKEHQFSYGLEPRSQMTRSEPSDDQNDAISHFKVAGKKVRRFTNSRAYRTEMSYHDQQPSNVCYSCFRYDMVMLLAAVINSL